MKRPSQRKCGPLGIVVDILDTPTLSAVIDVDISPVNMPIGRFAVSAVAIVVMLIASAGICRADLILFADDFESYSGTTSYGTSQVIANSAGTGLGPADTNVPNNHWEPKIATANNTDIKAVVVGSTQVAYLGSASGQNGIGVSTGGYTVTSVSADLIRPTSTTGSVIGLGFWSTFPAGTAAPATNFTGLRVTATQIQLLQGGASVAGGTFNHGDANIFATVGAPYALSYDINSDGSLANVVLNSTDYTASLSAVNVSGFFSSSAMAYVGGLVNNGGSARGAIDNFVVTASGVPEPASLTLALMSGLVASNRKRSARRKP